MRVKTPAPTFYKGDLVRPVSQILGWRRSTPAETQAWYDHFRAECRAGRDVWHDDAGESRLAPLDAGFALTPEMTLTVVRGRASAPTGYGKTTGCALVFCPDNGETLFVKRRYLTDKL